MTASDARYLVAVRHHQAEEFAAAEALYVQLLRADPSDAHLINLLGVLHSQTGRHESAEALLVRALELAPGRLDYLTNLGEVLRAANRPARTIEVMAQVVAAAPGEIEPLLVLGAAQGDAGQGEAAIATMRRAVALAPQSAKAWFFLAQQLEAAGETGPSIDAVLRSLMLDKTRADAWLLLGRGLVEERRYADALTAIERARQVAPDSGAVEYDRAVLLSYLGRSEEAWTAFDRAARLDPAEPRAIINRGLMRMIQGRLQDGWGDYERRFEAMPDGRVTRLPPAPAWAGEDPAGKHLLVYGEQGHGDTLQFIRYVPLLAARGAILTVAVQPALARLVARMPGIRQVIAGDAAHVAVDYHVALLSLPRLFGTELATVPATVPYVTPDPAARARWRGIARDRRNVGLVWAGDPRPDIKASNRIDRRRSMRLADLAPLAAVEGIRFYNLQKGAPAAEIARADNPFTLVDHMPAMGDFADTAALVAELDLVITVDTAMAHLAGALGVPTWMLSRFDNCWRWLEAREDSPWYPTLRIFRQRTPGDWAEVVARVARALAEDR